MALILCPICTQDQRRRTKAAILVRMYDVTFVSVLPFSCRVIKYRITMAERFHTSDTHLGDEQMLTFKREDGSFIRPFSCLDEMHETIIDNHNRMVGPKDTVIFQGDVVTNKKYLPLLDRMNGRKRLLSGNHDIFGSKVYAAYFEDIASYKIYTTEGIVCSHIPIAIESRGKFRLNVHGHTHTKSLPNPFYYNICLEQFGFSPVPLDDIVKFMDRYLPIFEEGHSDDFGFSP